MHLHNICEAATTDEDDEEEDTAKKDVFNNSSNLENTINEKKLSYDCGFKKFAVYEYSIWIFIVLKVGFKRKRGIKWLHFY